MLVGRLILYEQIHVCVTKVKIPKAKLTFATKMTAMINMSSLLCVHFVFVILILCYAMLRYIFTLFTYNLSNYFNS